jgi:hypothetical protein
MRNQGSLVRIATGYRLDGRGSVTDGGKSFVHSVQTSSGAHPASYPMGTQGVLFSEVKRAGCGADHSPPSSSDAKNDGAVPSLPYTSICYSA